MTESLRIRENLAFDGGIRKSPNLNQELHGTVLFWNQSTNQYRNAWSVRSFNWEISHGRWTTSKER